MYINHNHGHPRSMNQPRGQVWAQTNSRFNQRGRETDRDTQTRQTSLFFPFASWGELGWIRIYTRKTKIVCSLASSRADLLVTVESCTVGARGVEPWLGARLSARAVNLYLAGCLVYVSRYERVFPSTLYLSFVVSYYSVVRK